MKSILNFIARRLGRDSYELDAAFRISDLVELCLEKFFQIIRFYLMRLRLNKAGHINFVSSKIKLSYARHISIGSSVFIGQGVSINALCRTGVIIGNNVTIKAGCRIDCTGVYTELGEGLQIGNRVGISEDCFIQVRGQVIIDDDVIMGPGVKIFSENHLFSDSTQLIRNQGTNRIGVNIGKGVWIGTSAIILDGVSIGEGSVIGAGSLVTKDVPARSLSLGVPARKIADL